MNIDCPLCSPDLVPIILESKYWRLVLNRNQYLLGKCFLVLKRHIEALSDLSSSEWMDLHEQLALATKLLEEAFRPDHFNYAFLQNQDRHVHMHIIPRYKGQRYFAGIAFEDTGYPGHYLFDMSSRKLPDEFLVKLAENLMSNARCNLAI
jgi:diadenosine tetraphosphate (Ap4A) HIT family hydrolase